MRSTRFGWCVCGFALWLCVGCGDDDGKVSAVDGGDPDSALTDCRNDDDCNDGVFCNGIERCAPAASAAASDGCVAGSPPRCDDRLDCTTDSCSHVVNGCRFVPIDADGDDHPAATCVTDIGESLGDDCDDNDANRFPGNPETCTADTEKHDEDCDAATVGARDLDGDTATDIACCNGTNCGNDCDDDNPRRGSDYPEVCDEIDNDCDRRTDEDAVNRPWYPDMDRDGFGDSAGVLIDSCAPVPLHSLFGTDCDDSAARLNPAALEICDGVDNDCDGATDEDDVCSCGVAGSDPCECVSGSVDCLGGLIPRTCVRGHWAAGTACVGLTPICAIGRCVCADGGTSCIEVIDRSPPFVLASAPGADALRVSTAAVVVAVLSEPPAASTVDVMNFRVLDDNGVGVIGDRTIDGQLVSFTATDELLPGHIYTVVIENVTDRAGNEMTSPTSWRFATAVGGYGREVINEGSGIGFNAPVLRTSPAGEVALWADTHPYCSDCVTSGESVYRRSPNGVWTSTAWPNQISFNEVAPESFAIGSGGMIAAFVPGVSPFELLRHRPTDTVWDIAEATARAAPAALTVLGDSIVSATVSASDPTVIEVATATGLASLTALAGTGGIDASSGVAVAALDADTIAVVALSPTQVTVAHYDNAVWKVASAPAGMARDASVHLRPDGTAVATWLQGAGVATTNGGPLLFGLVQHVAFFSASIAALLPVALSTTSVHSAPQVAWLDATHAIAWHGETRGTPEMETDPVVHVVSIDGSAASPLFPAGQLSGGPTSVADLTLLPNGNATMVWAHAGSFFGDNVLIARRYAGGVWLPVEAIADSLSPSQPQVEALPDNASLVVWKQEAVQHGVATVLP